jgi:hypothetical protein
MVASTPFLSNGGAIGHFCNGHKPDHTWEDPDKAMVMARRVYEDLKYIRNHGNKYEPNGWMSMSDPPDPITDNSDLTWNKIRKQIYDFASFIPETVHDPLQTGIHFQTVTQKGYLDKVRILFPGYTLNDGDARYLKSVTITKRSWASYLNVGDLMMDPGFGL